MKKTTAYAINHEENTITLTRDFAKRSGIINSNEYRVLTQFRKDYPDYKIQKRTAAKNTNKDTHKGLTVEFMGKCLDKVENSAAEKAEFERVKTFYKGNSAYYAKVKAWFLAKYPDYDPYAPAKPIEADNAQNAEVTTTETAA
jgi:hypothetical protein